ncbi:MAG TPA: GNAT family N-acetyltransferase [Candidatus Limnocylindrales bacterium]
MLIDHWPLLGLKLTTPRLELRLPTGDELAALAELAARGVHRPGETPFLTPWTDLPPAQRARDVVQGHWGDCGDWKPEDWSLGLVVFEDRKPLGVQNMRARDFPVLREVASSSWLGLDHHGRGIGTEMRQRQMSFVDNPCLELFGVKGLKG